MLYIINGKYYMLRNREYVAVNVKLTDNELSIAPDRKDVIEYTKDLKVRHILIDDIIKKLKKEGFKKESTETNKKYNM